MPPEDGVQRRPPMTVIVDLIARGIPLAFAGVLLAGCASTTHFSSEYSRDYHLIRDVHVRQCEMFIGGWSLWFGPDRVACIQSLHDGRESASDLVFRQDSL